MELWEFIKECLKLSFNIFIAISQIASLIFGTLGFIACLRNKHWVGVVIGITYIAIFIALFWAYL